MIEPALLPDAEEVFAKFLAGRPEMAGVLVGTRVPSTYDGSQKVVRIVRIGGGADYLLRFDRPRFDIDCFGPDKASASDLTTLVRRLAIFDVRYSDLSAYGASVSEVIEDVGPQWLDEPDYPNAGRYLFQVTAMIHAL